MGGSSFELGESIRVVSDDYNNALLVYASPYEYGKIERILKKLDVIATQVLIEASIVEVTAGRWFAVWIGVDFPEWHW